MQLPRILCSYGGAVFGCREKIVRRQHSRTVTNDKLQKIVEDHGAIDREGRATEIMEPFKDANTGAEKLNGTPIGGRDIKVNVSEKPLPSLDLSLLQAQESLFVDSPHKVYVGNTLKAFFADKGKVVSAKVSRVPGTSKCSGYGFVTVFSEEDVEAAISSLNNMVLEGQKVLVNKS